MTARTTSGTARNSPAHPQRTNRVAAVVNEYWAGSHADLIVGKLIGGYEVMWTPIHPHIDVTSLYVHDPGPADIGARVADEHGIGLHPGIAETLRRGGPAVDVEGVVLIGERNERSGRPLELDERGRPIDPRFDFFMEVAKVCEGDGRPVPVFIDKYLGRTWEEIKAVYETARRLQMPLMAGSSVPVTLRSPTQVPLGAPVEEIVVAATGIGEAPIFHPLELVQSMIERRGGHETGVASVQYLSGDAFWSAWESGERWSAELCDAALAEVPHHDEPPKDFYARRRAAREGQSPPEPSSPGPSSPGPSRPAGAEEAVLVQYLDGTRLAILLLTGYMLRRSVAIRLRGQRTPLVTSSPTGVKLADETMGSVKAAVPGQAKPSTWNFDHLVYFVDDFMQTGVPRFPIERTLLTSGILDAAMTSRHRGGALVETPHLAIEYWSMTL
jgi:hypothetical protein